MHIDESIGSYLYNKNEFITWLDNQVYIFGVKNIELLNDKKLIVNLLNSNIIITGINIRVLKSNEKELVINGEIDAIKKELCHI